MYPVQTLTDTLCNELGKDNLKLNTKVLSLSYCDGGSSFSENWSITCASNQDARAVDAVVMTVSLSSSLFPFPNSNNIDTALYA